ncbi:hypothetical protein HPP92_021731 [Vanilla planifolia]|uniref:Uncharacterized protein n=1 Tax=Vanilla planifolia TaxID=51239 RepID=A0A835UES0_VANPL|nr:hypothetical protein HPP92_021731 [Vanilla planifolia]
MEKEDLEGRSEKMSFFFKIKEGKLRGESLVNARDVQCKSSIRMKREMDLKLDELEDLMDLQVGEEDLE